MDPALPQSTGARRPTNAHLLAAFLTVVATLLFADFLLTAHRFPFVNALSTLPKSPAWIFVLLDYLVGACFAALFIYFRNGPSVLFLSPKFFAFVFPFIGNFALLFYVAYLLVETNDITLALLPYSMYATIRHVPTGANSNRNQTRFISFLFFVLFLLTSFSYVYVYKRTTFQIAYQAVTKGWPLFTLLEDLTGALFAIIFIILRARQFNCFLFLWIFGIILCGNSVTCLYVMNIAREALAQDLHFSHVLLSKSQPL